MTEFILGGIVVAQIGVLVYVLRESEKVKNKLINAILSKTPEDLVNLTIADQVKPEPVFDDRLSKDLVSERDLTDEEFDKFIVKGTTNGE